MSSKIVRVFNERCEADAYCAVRACSHKRMYADRLITRHEHEAHAECEWHRSMCEADSLRTGLHNVIHTLWTTCG